MNLIHRLISYFLSDSLLRVKLLMRDCNYAWWLSVTRCYCEEPVDDFLVSVGVATHHK